MRITLNISFDAYSKPDAKGKCKLVKRGVVIKKQFDTSSILVNQYIDDKGRVSKKFCEIKDGDLVYKAVHQFNEIEKLINPVIVKGFQNDKGI